jgi:hypothetical protein
MVCRSIPLRQAANVGMALPDNRLVSADCQTLPCQAAAVTGCSWRRDSSFHMRRMTHWPGVACWLGRPQSSFALTELAVQVGAGVVEVAVLGRHGPRTARCGDGEGVEGGHPAVHPAFVAGTFRVEVPTEVTYL